MKKFLLPCLLFVLCLVVTSCTPACEHEAGKQWEADQTTHWHVCSKCGEKVDEAEHTWGEWIVSVPASVGAEGSQYRQCTVCKKAEVQAIPAIVLATGEAQADVAVYVKAPADWSVVNCYYWGDNVESNKTVGWPGQEMTLVNAEENVWGFIVPAGTANIIFNNGSTQTADLLFGTETNLYTLTVANAEGKLLADYGEYVPAADQPELNKYPISEAETFRTIYVQLPESWAAQNVHYWGAGVGSEWPGDPLTVVDAEKHVYSFELSSKVTGFLFNAGDGQPQTSNVLPNEAVNGYVVSVDDKGNVSVTACTYSEGGFTEVELGPVEVVLYVKGSMNVWSDNDAFKLVVDGDNASLQVALVEGDEFKIATSAWDIQFGSGNTEMDAACFVANGENIKCLVAGTYLITVVNYNSDARTCSIVAVSAE